MSDTSFPPGGDPDRLFLSEVARLRPDVDVVDAGVARASGQPPPGDAEIDAALAGRRDAAVATTAWVWNELLAGLAAPAAMELFWMTHDLSDVVSAETASGPVDGVALLPHLAMVSDRLAASGWDGEVRPGADGSARIVAQRAPVRVVVRFDRTGAVGVRVTTAGTVVGVERATELSRAEHAETIELT